MQPLSSKELNYLTDCMKNEDLLVKECATAASHASSPDVQQLLTQAAQTHMQHYNQLLQTLQQHVGLAPGAAQGTLH
ncbi:MAG: hypothetical protein K6T78_01720 [Alicyclobacillus sp.]|nr:hypothetical protein [Alicyclobacillus sp.]